MIDFEDTNALPAATVAFERSAGYEFLGKPLQPFSFRRKTAAIALGLGYWRVTPDDVIESPNPRKDLLLDPECTLTPEERATIEEEPATLVAYRQLPFDVALVLWLCHQPDSVVLRARRKPRDYEDEIDNWADKAGVSIGAPNYGEAVQVFQEIMLDINASEGRADVKPGASPAAESGN